jgi:phage terminase large subunit GpA-like protein
MNSPPRFKVTCPHCNTPFQEKVRSVRAGAFLPCPHCKLEIAFSDNSNNENVRKALSMARRLRLATPSP